MPRWGLTLEQRREKPWGISMALLQPQKAITDPVHGDIYVTELERAVLDSPALQRLRRVRQLGTTHLVYPGATHTRFAHALGALRVAQDLMDAVLGHRLGKNPKPDLFLEWEAGDPKNVNKWIAEATVLARLGALLHDLCHVSYGHSLEDDLGILTPHDKNKQRFEILWAQLVSALPADDQRVLRSGPLKDALRPLILSKEDKDWPKRARRYQFVADIVGNTICADLLDYLARDYLNTGLPMRLGRRFLDGFYVTPTDSIQAGEYGARMVCQISRGGRERADMVSELFKYLRYRYELSERALVQHAKLATDAMIGKLLEILVDDKTVQLVARRYPDAGVGVNDSADQAVTSMREAGWAEGYGDCQMEARQSLESLLLRHGDDGLLEHVLLQVDADDMESKGEFDEERFFIAPRPGCFSEARRAPIRELTEGVLNRRLYKLCGRSAQSTLSAAKTLYLQHGPPEHRRALEESVATFVGLDESWHVILWIPHPDMRLKAAGVLIDDGRLLIRPLMEYDDKGRGRRGQEIYDSHAQLWGISVFVPEAVLGDPEKVDFMLAWLGGAFGGIEWEGWGRRTVQELIARKVGGDLHPHDEKRLAELIGQDAAFRGSGNSIGIRQQGGRALTVAELEARAVEIRESELPGRRGRPKGAETLMA